MLKRKIALWIAKIVWWMLTGKLVKVANVIIQLPVPSGTRPIDEAIMRHKEALSIWNHEQRKEIIAAILNWEYPGKHIHGNPVKKQKQTEGAA